MFFKKKKKEKDFKLEELIGFQCQLVNDLTVFQTGNIAFDGQKIPVKTADKSEIYVNSFVEVIGVDYPCLIVKKI